MNNPGVYDLGSATIGTAVTELVITSATDIEGVLRAYLSGLDGMLGATIDINFTYGGGGATAAVMVETSLNQGATWIEVYRAAFLLASGERTVNLSGLTPVTTPYTPAALADNTVKDGLLGDRWRVRLTTTGTYSGNTSIAVRLTTR